MYQSQSFTLDKGVIAVNMNSHTCSSLKGGLSIFDSPIVETWEDLREFHGSQK